MPRHGIATRPVLGIGDPRHRVVVSQAEVDKWRGVRGSLVHAALADGRVLAA
jgi:hypothetical protein